VTAYGRPSLIQAQKNAEKIARSAIRLKHSIAADNELNEVMPVLAERLAAMLQTGRIPRLTMGEIEDIVNRVDE
jgi:hypothetical protein